MALRGTVPYERCFTVLEPFLTAGQTHAPFASDGSTRRQDWSRMAEDLVKSAGSLPETPLLRGWRSVMFAPAGDGQRRRRGSDGARLAGAVLALVCCVLVIRYDSRIDRAIVQVIHPPPRSITWLVSVVYDAGTYGITILLVALALVARRWVIARDIALSAAGTALVSGILTLALGSRGGRPSGIVINGYYMRFPVLQIALFMAVATAALPYLARGVQRLIELFLALVALASAVGGHGLPLNVLGSLAIGWGVTAGVRLVFGSPLGLPSADDVQLLLNELGIRSVGVHPMTRQVWGVAKYDATETGRADSPGQHIGIAVYGRDAADARLLTKTGRFLFYRDSGPSLTLTRLQQVEHEAYLTMRAGQAGVAVPEIVEAGTAGPSKDALIVYRMPAGTTLSGADANIGDAALDDVYRHLLTLRRARIAHGAMSGDALLVDPAAQTIVVTDFRNATSNASLDQLDRDMAGAIAATAAAVGPERAADAAARCLDPDVLGGALQHLRQAGLDPALNRSLRGKRGLLEDVRQRAARAKSIDVPKLIEPRRVSWPTLIMVVGTLIGGWALIGVLIDVSASFDTVIGADWVWVVVAFILSQLAYVASAVEAIGSVAGPLPFGRAVAVEVANSFSALAGGTAAVFATRVRFYQQQGYDASVALSSGAIMAASSWIAMTVLFLVSLPFSWGSIHIEATPQSGGDSKLVWIILAVVVVVALVAGLLLAVPRLRRLAAEKVRPKVRDIWGNLKQVASSPRKLVLLVGGSFAQELLVAMALSVSLRAFGDHLRLPTLIVVITLAGIIGGISPSPGGMGVVEAGMILGLTAAGVSESDATAAVFIQRLFTSYLPPIWGWITLVWMRRREYL
jgi:glycosyltransferase 2 family protein